MSSPVATTSRRSAAAARDDDPGDLPRGADLVQGPGQLPVQLDDVQRQRGQCGRPQPSADVLDRDRDAGPAQPDQGVDDGRRRPQQDRLAHLHDQPVGAQAGCGDRFEKGVRGALPGQLGAVEVDGELHVVTHRPPVRSVGERVAGRLAVVGLAAPAGRELEPDPAAGDEVDDRLVVRAVRIGGAVEPDPVPAAVLGQVERGVGAFQQPLPGPARGQFRHPGRGGRPSGQPGPQPVHQFLRTRPRTGEDHDELVPADPGQLPGGAEVPPGLADPDEHPVAGGVPEAVVELLEVVQVQHRHAQRRPLAGGRRESRVQHPVEAAPVQQPGQRVQLGPVSQPHQPADGQCHRHRRRQRHRLPAAGDTRCAEGDRRGTDHEQQLQGRADPGERHAGDRDEHPQRADAERGPGAGQRHPGGDQQRAGRDQRVQRARPDPAARQEQQDPDQQPAARDGEQRVRTGQRAVGGAREQARGAAGDVQQRGRGGRDPPGDDRGPAQQRCRDRTTHRTTRRAVHRAADGPTDRRGGAGRAHAVRLSQADRVVGDGHPMSSRSGAPPAPETRTVVRGTLGVTEGRPAPWTAAPPGAPDSPT